jgi:type II secretory pathway pseudopilin PulG
MSRLRPIGSDTRGDIRRHGFTMTEAVVVVAIFFVLLSIFVPYLLSLRESNRRAVCIQNLSQIFGALQTYARDFNWEFPSVRTDPDSNRAGYTAFTGADSPNPFAADSAVQHNDVTASLWLLVRIGYITDTSVFVCPSSNGKRDLLLGPNGKTIDPKLRGNFRAAENLTYSFASPFSRTRGYRLKPDLLSWDFAVLADQNPGDDAALVDASADPRQSARGNSTNHGRAGQHVIYADSHVKFQTTPYSGPGHMDSSDPKIPFKPGDNIYTARAQRPSTQPTSLPVTVAGYVGRNVGPTGNDDSYLVPTARDAFIAILPAPTTLPSTRPATAP